MRSNCEVEELNVCNNAIDDQHMAMLVEALHEGVARLRCLYASHNELSAASLSALLPFCCSAAAALKPEAAPPPAQRLLVSLRAGAPNVLAGAQSLGPPGTWRAPRGAGITLLTHLDLSGNPIGDVAVRRLCMRMCAGGLECALKVLALESCGLTAQCAPALEEMLLNSRTLSALSLAWNTFGVRGARALARGIESNISLRHLNLAWTGLGDSGCAHVAHGAQAQLRVASG